VVEHVASEQGIAASRGDATHCGYDEPFHRHPCVINWPLRVRAVVAPYLNQPFRGQPELPH
jgi:hypothetical protein